MISKSEVGSIALDFDRRIRGMCCSEWNDCVRISELIAIGRFSEAFLGCADLIVNEGPIAAGRLRQLGSALGSSAKEGVRECAIAARCEHLLADLGVDLGQRVNLVEEPIVVVSSRATSVTTCSPPKQPTSTRSE